MPKIICAECGLPLEDCEQRYPAHAARRRKTRLATPPKCRLCGKELERYYVTVTSGQVIKVGDEVGHPYDLDRRVTVLQIARQKPDLFDKDLTEYRVWYGEFGKDGDGHFCTQKCGYRYGLQAAQQKRKSR